MPEHSHTVGMLTCSCCVHQHLRRQLLEDWHRWTLLRSGGHRRLFHATGRPFSHALLSTTVKRGRDLLGPSPIAEGSAGASEAAMRQQTDSPGVAAPRRLSYSGALVSLGCMSKVCIADLRIAAGFGSEGELADAAGQGHGSSGQTTTNLATPEEAALAFQWAGSRAQSVVASTGAAPLSVAALMARMQRLKSRQ